MSTLTEFIAKYTGARNVGNTPQNRGECVGLVMVWTESLGLPHTWGNAKDLFANANRAAFDAVPNTPDGVPSPGDVFCFNGNYGGGVGHTGLVASANKNTVTLFQQNDPTGTTPHLKTYSYTHAIGWLRPKVLNSNQGSSVMTPEQEKQAYLIALGRPQEGVPSGRTAFQFILDARGELDQQRANARQVSAERDGLRKERDAVTSLVNQQKTQLVGLTQTNEGLKAQGASQGHIITALNLEREAAAANIAKLETALKAAEAKAMSIPLPSGPLTPPTAPGASSAPTGPKLSDTVSKYAKALVTLPAVSAAVAAAVADGAVTSGELGAIGMAILTGVLVYLVPNKKG